MQLSLAPFGPPMWYLVSPNISVSLTIASPGPIDVDFHLLTLEQKRYIYNSIRESQIMSDVPLENLYDEIFPPVAMEIPQEIQEVQEPDPVIPPPPPSASPVIQPDKPAVSLDDKFAKMHELVQQKRTKLLERSKYLLTQKASLIQATLQSEEDVSLLREMVEMELEGRKRRGVLAFLRKKISLLQKKKVQKIEESLYQDNYKRPSKEPIMETSESDKEIILVGVHE